MLNTYLFICSSPEIGNDCSIRVFWVQVYNLLDYFNRTLYKNVWAPVELIIFGEKYLQKSYYLLSSIASKNEKFVQLIWNFAHCSYLPWVYIEIWSLCRFDLWCPLQTTVHFMLTFVYIIITYTTLNLFNLGAKLKIVIQYTSWYLLQVHSIFHFKVMVIFTSTYKFNCPHNYTLLHSLFATQ